MTDHDRPILAHFLRDGVTPKKQFTRYQALVARREIEDSDFFERRIFHSYIDAYLCRDCGAWHVGNLNRSRERNKRRLKEAQG